jgi:PAS domain S-box-containing protein
VDAAANASLPYYVLFGGLIVSALLFAFVFMLLGSRTRAVALADRMTRSQRRIVDTSRDLIGSMDSALKWTTMNPALHEVLGYEVADILGRDHLDMVFPADRDMLRERLATAPDEQSISLTARYAHKHGGLRWIDWNITSSRKDGRVYCIGRDITDAVLAEKEIVRKNAILDLASVITDRENVRKEQAIRDQNTRFRMEMTSVIGFLELILQNPDFTSEEILDYVSTANEGAQGVMRELHSMTEVELRRMADFRFDIRDHDAKALLDALHAAVHAATAQLPVELATSDAWTGGVHADVDKIADALRLLFASLQDANIRCESVTIEREQSAAEDRFAFRLRIDGLSDLPETARWLPSAERDHMTAVQDEAEFARMLLRPMFDIMDASIDVRVESEHRRAVILLDVPESSEA